MSTKNKINKIKHLIKKYGEEWDVNWDDEGIAFYFRGQKTKCYFLHKNGDKEYLDLNMEVVAHGNVGERGRDSWGYHILAVSEDTHEIYGEFDSKKDENEVFVHAWQAMKEANRRAKKLDFLDYNKINRRIKKDKDIVTFVRPKKKINKRR